MARTVRVTVDHNVCVGNAMCETIAPKVFVLNDNRQSEAVSLLSLAFKAIFIPL
jgi:ferredoxin